MRVFLALVATSVLLAGCADPELDACDSAIKATLKAPTSYKRVSAESVVPGKDGYYKITYDAVNSYNAPLRGAGACFLKGGKAEWFNHTRPE